MIVFFIKNSNNKNNSPPMEKKHLNVFVNFNRHEDWDKEEQKKDLCHLCCLPGNNKDFKSFQLR